MALSFGPLRSPTIQSLVSTASSALPATFVTIHIWACQYGLGGTSQGTMWDHGNGSFSLLVDPSDSTLWRFVGSSTTSWTFTAPPLGDWVPLTVVVDTSATSNNPDIWLDGRKLTVSGGELTQVGVDSAYLVSSATWAIGGRNASSLRSWDGFLAEFAVFDGALLDSAVQYLHEGNRVDGISRMAKAIEYNPLDISSSSKAGKMYSPPKGQPVVLDPPQIVSRRPLKKYWAGLLTAVTYDLTSAILTFTAKNPQNTINNLPSAASLGYSAKSLASVQSGALTAAALQLTPANPQLTLQAILSSPVFTLTAASLASAFTTALSAATFTFSAKDISAAGETMLELTAATFSYVAAETQNVLQVTLDSPTFRFVTAAIVATIGGVIVGVLLRLLPLMGAGL